MREAELLIIFDLIIDFKGNWESQTNSLWRIVYTHP
jgi:hypothetical protein